MRAVGAARWFLFSTSIVALAAIFGPERALAGPCTYPTDTNTFTNVFALTNTAVCTVVTGTYNPLTTPPSGVTLPSGVTYTGFGFFAYGGGVINSPNVGINTPALGDAYGAWSNGTNSSINFLGAVTDVSTIGDSAHDLYASNGGAIALGGAKIKSTGIGAFGLYASGGESTITVNGSPTIQTFGAGADGAVADLGGAVSLMNGGQITTNAGGSIGLVVRGSSSTIIGSGVVRGVQWRLRISSGHSRRAQ
jgi:hypothetical protein